MNETKKPVRSVIRIVLICIAALIALLVIVIAVNASKNNKIMHQTIDKGMQELSARYNVTPRDPGEYEDMTMYGLMKFHVDQYDVEELGNLSVMTANMGFMQMVSYMITPYEKNVPLCTLDFMYIMGNRKSYVEFYDLVGDTKTEDYRHVLENLTDMTARYDEVTELPVDAAWYDSYLSVDMHKELKDDELNEQMFCDALETYLDASKEMETSSAEDAAKQLEITQGYSNGLIENGGVSTDVFKKALGEETTRDFFDQVFFGSSLYQTAQ
ncbi:MAG: hypothetical protein IJ906_03280 [Oscillospiraceae bacterium]|nr:hypothetical protein [Oscillospiraceae bacterium]